MAIRRVGPISTAVASTLIINALATLGSTTEVHIVCRDSNGDPTVPGAGTFTLTAQTNTDGAFYAISDGGTLDATLCGGSATPDGTGVYASFRGVPTKIKIVPTAVTGAITYSAEIIQIGI